MSLLRFHLEADVFYGVVGRTGVCADVNARRRPSRRRLLARSPKRSLNLMPLSTENPVESIFNVTVAI